MSDQTIITQEIYFIDTGVLDYQNLINHLPSEAVYYLLDTQQDGLTQIVNTLSNYTELTSIHIISHGASGQLRLGNSLINETNLQNYQTTLTTIGQSLSEQGDILFYSCNLAEDEQGQVLIQQLAMMSGADIAASTNRTGNEQYGGDWQLEARVGLIETASVAIQDYAYVLADNTAPLFAIKTLSSINNTKLFFDHTVSEWINSNAFAALKVDGSIVTWGNSSFGGNSSTVASQLDGTTDVAQVYSTTYAFAALRTDGSVVTWGDATWGGDSSSVATALNGTIDVTQIYSTSFAFAALRADGSVITWGDTTWGGDSSSVASQLDGSVDVVQIYSTGDAFAALRVDGSVVTWGNSANGGNSSTVATALNGTIDVTQIYSTAFAFAALRADGSVVTWGNTTDGGDSSGVATQLNGTTDVTQIYATAYAFAALYPDGSVVTWGNSNYGGDSSTVATQINGTIDVTQIYSSYRAFAALRSDGSVITWGDNSAGADSSTVATQLNGTTDVIEITSGYYAFAALRSDGSVITWGDITAGGDSSSVASQINGTIDVTRIYSSRLAFAALRTDGSVVTWGDTNAGGDSSSVASALNGTIDVVDIYSTGSAFAALRSDGSVITWGSSANGGDSSAVTSQINSNVISISNILTHDSYSLQDTLGGVVNFTEDGTAVILDNNVQITDAELDLTNYNGASLTLARQSGANSEDIFSSAVFSGSDIIVSNTNIGSVSQANGSLTLTFNSNATQTLVSSALQQIAYRNNSDAPPASVVIAWVFNDGNTGLQGTGGALNATGSTTVNISARNDSPTFSSLAVTLNYTDSVFDDTFNITNGQLIVNDLDGDSLSYSMTNFDLDNGTIVRKTTAYGILEIIKATGHYSFTPNDNAIEPLTTNQTITFTVTVFDGVVTVNQTFTVQIDQDGTTESILADTLIGTLNNDTFNALAGNDIINGLAGADDMSGGSGDDFYFVDNIGDLAKENSNEGIDTVNSIIDYILPNDVENLILNGTAIQGTGNTLNNLLKGNNLNNTLTGLAGADTLTGLTGADTLIGGLGNDSYVVENIGDVILENSNQGLDLVYASITYTLLDNVEDLLLTGTNAINGTGNAETNRLIGNDANNILNGKAGVDIMNGGQGDDSYIVDNFNDWVTEAVNGGIDIVYTTVNYAIMSNIEVLVLNEGSGNLTGWGSFGNDRIRGNSDNNILNGWLGADTLLGDLGDDIYIVDNINDILIENANTGIDIVYSSVSYTLVNNIETLVILGTAIQATGNALNNRLHGNNLDNTLNGWTGADTMIGGLGNDNYIVDNANDWVTEEIAQGTDTIYSSASYALTPNTENLILTETAAINGFGNDDHNFLQGNSANNTLTGKLGADILVGGAGKDSYNLFENTASTDTVRIAAGESLVNNFDITNFFKLGTGVANTDADKLDLATSTIAANIASFDGVDSGTIRSHNLSNGMARFDDVNTFSSALTISSATNLNNVLIYLQNNITGGNTVAFIADGNTYVFQDGVANDTLVELVGNSASSLSTTGLDAGSVWIV